jgi:outer membrane protein OmpA-like peptidoglycan-associated protein
LPPPPPPAPAQQQQVIQAPAGGAVGIPVQGVQGQSPTQSRRIDSLRGERREERQGDRVIIREPDRVIVREGGRSFVRHDERNRFRFNARNVTNERRGAETVNIIERPNGTRIVSVYDDDGRLIRRMRRDSGGRDLIIIDNRRRGIVAGSYFVDLPPPVIRMPRERYIVELEHAPPPLVYETLMAPPVEAIERPYSLEEVRYSPQLRDRMPRVDVDTITFETGSWEITPDQAQRLEVIADGIRRALEQNPAEVFLIEGHTDAVGADVDNLSLSDRRAESVALVLTEQFQIPAENLTSQGYGEQYLKVPTQGPERTNRRVSLRRITPLLTGQAQQQ